MHIPVLLNEVLQYLDPKPGDNFIDCTVGGGGHALAFLKMTVPGGKVLGVDRDADMVARLCEQAEKLGIGDRLILTHGNFAEVLDIAARTNFSPVQGILFDFGMSSWQLEESGAGFSFQNIEPLDMRYDRTGSANTAAEIVNSWPQEAIRRILWEFGEERYAGRFAKEIVSARKRKRIETTDQLVGILSRARPRRRGRDNLHFATRTFQALRIAVNEELENVEKGLRDAITLLFPGGRIAAISFHSLEDRRVKQIFREYSKAEEGFSATSCALKIITKKPVRPTREEIEENPRARSAKLRVAQKL